MDSVGTYEAKTHFSQLLERVSKGESFTITKHGVPVAVLQPAETRAKRPLPELMEDFKRFAEGHARGGLTIREMIEEGRD